MQTDEQREVPLGVPARFVPRRQDVHSRRRLRTPTPVSLFSGAGHTVEGQATAADAVREGAGDDVIEGDDVVAGSAEAAVDDMGASTVGPSCGVFS